MDFEYDEQKSRANEVKHGIDFANAQSLWLDDLRVEVAAKALDEPRFAVIGRVDGRHWTAIITYRDGRLRIISVRRSRPKEVVMYESQ